MKFRNIIITFCLVIVTGFTLGANGVLALQERKPERKPQTNGIGDARLIGVLITRDEGLFGWNEEEALEAALRQQFDSDSVISTSRDSNRRYATYVEQPGAAYSEDGTSYTDRKYVFDGIDGYVILAPFFHIDGQNVPLQSLQADKVASGVKAHFSAGDDSRNAVTLSATVCLSDENFAADGDYNPDGKLIFVHPVYETSSGEVYAVPAMGYLLSAYGGSTTISYREEVLNSKETVIRSNSASAVSANTPSPSASCSEVSITIVRRNPTKSLTVLCYGADGSMKGRTELEAGKIPETFRTATGTEYLIAETVSVLDGQTVTERTLIQKDDSNTQTILYGVPYENGFVIPQACEIDWR